MSIDWKAVAKQNNMSYTEFEKELYITVMAFMVSAMERKSSNEMNVTNENIKLTCRILPNET